MTILRRIILWLICLVPAIASADPTVRDLALSLGVGVSDNIGGLYVDQVSDTVAAVGIETRLKREARRASLSLTTDVQYISYLKGTFEDELAGNANLEARGILVEDRISWTLQDTWGQTQIAPFAPVTPENQQNTNVVSTGPELRWEISNEWSLLASALAIRESYERTSVDNNRRFGEVGLVRRSSRGTSIAMLLNTQSVEFIDDSSAGDFDRHEALLRYQTRTPRMVAMVDVGRTELRDGSIAQGQWLARFDIERRVTRRTTLRVIGGQEPSDTGTLFAGAEAAVDRGGVGLGGGARLRAIGNGGIIAVADSLQNQFGSIGWRLETSRTVATASVEYRRERYATRTELDRTSRATRIGIARDLSSSLRISLESSNYISRALNEGTVFRDVVVTASGIWRITSRTSLDVSAEHFVRGGSSTGGGFDDNRLLIRVRYAPLSDRPSPEI